MMPAVRMPLIQSAMALRTVSIQSPSLAEMVDEGLEEIQEKNNVGQKLHKKHFLSLMGGDSYRNALLMIKSCYPQQRWSDCVCTGGKPRLRLLAEQTRQQRNEGDAHQSNAAASHELLHALRLRAG